MLLQSWKFGNGECASLLIKASPDFATFRAARNPFLAPFCPSSSFKIQVFQNDQYSWWQESYLFFDKSTLFEIRISRMPISIYYEEFHVFFWQISSFARRTVCLTAVSHIPGLKKYQEKKKNLFYKNDGCISFSGHGRRCTRANFDWFHPIRMWSKKAVALSQTCHQVVSMQNEIEAMCTDSFERKPGTRKMRIIVSVD